jgi:hypothetical protein
MEPTITSITDSRIASVGSCASFELDELHALNHGGLK